MKRLLLFYFVVGSTQAACTGGDTCTRRCMHDEACMHSIAADGISPFGSTRGDNALCNGICSSLRTIERDAVKTRKDMGLPDAPTTHACMPQTAR